MSERVTMPKEDWIGALDAARAKSGVTKKLLSGELAGVIRGIQTGITGGGAAVSVPMKDVNFYDYDGTRLYSYTVEEAAALAELPPLPTQPGLTCQGWNWTLDAIKAIGREVDVGATYITDDGKTRIYITLTEGRTSPMLGCCPNGTVTVDWGDGSTPDVLTGTSVTDVKWTPTHEYDSPGDYVITLVVDGTMGFLGQSSSDSYSGVLRHSSEADTRNVVYQNAVQRIEIGEGVTHIGGYAFHSCYSLASITIPDSVKEIANNSFQNCYSLKSIVIPDGLTSIGTSAFFNCYNLSSVAIPDGLTSIGASAFYNCYNLSSVAIPDSMVTILGSAFYNCFSLPSITMPDSVTSISGMAFQGCYSLMNLTLPNGLANIANYTFCKCYRMSSIAIPGSVKSISSNAFENCYGVRYYDFTRSSSIPTLSNANAFKNISADCEIRVPSALVDTWKAATNWSTYADYIVGV